MPRIDRAEPPGCPPLRALCFDSLGLIKVVEAQPDRHDLQVVSRWGEPDIKRAILGVSLSHDDSPVLAVARKNGIVHVMNPSTGASFLEVNVITSTAKPLGDLGSQPKDKDAIAGIHLFRRDDLRRSLLTCTEDCNATLFCWSDSSDASPHALSHVNPISVSSRWTVNNGGSILSLRVDYSEKYAVFGGKGIDVNLWDLEKISKVWEAKTPRRDSVGLMSPPFVTASTFLSQTDHRKIVVGTGHHQMRLYDVSAQRRPVLAFDFQESPIKAVECDFDCYSVFAGNGNGDLASFDMRTGRLVGIFKGKSSGGIRSIARHPDLPLIASCGLDRFLRIFDIRSRQLLRRVFLKQQLLAVLFYNQEVAIEEKNVELSGGKEKQSVERLKAKKSKRMDGEMKRKKTRKKRREA